MVTEELCDVSLLVSVVGNVCFVLLLQDVALWRVAFVLHVLEVFVSNLLAKTCLIIYGFRAFSQMLTNRVVF